MKSGTPMSRLRDKLVLFVGLLLTTGCVAPMGTLHGGRTAPRHKFEVTAGEGVSVSTLVVGSVFDNAKNVARVVKEANDSGQDPMLTDDDKRDLIRGAFSFALFSPTPVSELTVRYGILDRWDAGLSLTSSGFRGETKVQLLRANIDSASSSPVDLAVGVQVMRQAFGIPLPGFIKSVFNIGDFKRTDLTIPLIASRTFNEFVWAYGGPKFLYSFISAEILETVTDVSGVNVALDRDLWAVGGVAGVAVGYKYVYAMLELNVAYYSFEADLLGVNTDLSGANFYPAVGVHINFY